MVHYRGWVKWGTLPLFTTFFMAGPLYPSPETHKPFQQPNTAGLEKLYKNWVSVFQTQENVILHHPKNFNFAPILPTYSFIEKKPVKTSKLSSEMKEHDVLHRCHWHINVLQLRIVSASSLISDSH